MGEAERKGGVKKMIGKLPEAACPVCGVVVKKPYLTSFSGYKERWFYECHRCRTKFIMHYDLRTKTRETEWSSNDV